MAPRNPHNPVPPTQVYEADRWRDATARLCLAARRLQDAAADQLSRDTRNRPAWDDLVDARQRLGTVLAQLDVLLTKRPGSFDDAAKQRPRTGADPVTGGPRRPAKDDEAPV